MIKFVSVSNFHTVNLCFKSYIMNARNIFKSLILGMIPVLGCVSCQSSGTPAQGEVVEETVTPKRVHTWVVYGDNFSWDNVEPVKDMIGSLSVFGNPTQEFFDKCHENGIEVYHAVGGKAADIDTPEKMNALIDSYMQECEKGYDGVDLDFEHLDASMQDTYTTFLRSTSKRLHDAGKKMSQCVGYYPAMFDNPDSTKLFHDPAVLVETCDLVRVMCYDMYFGPGVNTDEFAGRDDCSGMGPTTAYPWAVSNMTYWKERIPADKLVIGLPAYSNDYRMDGKLFGTQIYGDVPDKVKGELPDPRWLCYEKLNVYLYDHEDGSRHLFYASDSKSTAELLKLTEELGLSCTDCP